MKVQMENKPRHLSNKPIEYCTACKSPLYERFIHCPTEPERKICIPCSMDGLTKDSGEFSSSSAGEYIDCEGDEFGVIEFGHTV